MLPVLNNLLENREMQLEDGRFLVAPRRYDELVRDAAAELDPAKRMAMLQEAEAILVAELPILPIYNYVTQTTFSPRLGGYFPNVKDEHFPKFWYWMDEEELAAKRARLADAAALAATDRTLWNARSLVAWRQRQRAAPNMAASRSRSSAARSSHWNAIAHGVGARASGEHGG